VAVNTPTPEVEYKSLGKPPVHGRGAWVLGETAAAADGVRDGDGPKPGGRSEVPDEEALVHDVARAANATQTACCTTRRASPRSRRLLDLLRHIAVSLRRVGDQKRYLQCELRRTSLLP